MKQLTLDNLYFSLLFGRGIYQPEAQLVMDPLSPDNLTPASPLLVNVLTEESFFLKVLHCGEDELPRYQEQILNSAPRSSICWPFDLIALDETLSAEAKIFVSRRYAAAEEPYPEPGQYALLFRSAQVPDTIPWEYALKQVSSEEFYDYGTEKGRNWRNPEVRKLSIALIRALAQLNEAGYWFLDFHPSRFFVTKGKDRQVFLDYSNLIFSAEELSLEAANPVTSPAAGSFPFEYAEPAYVRDRHPVFDRETQNYSLAAFLFRLFYGRYAYEGDAMSGRQDYSEESHYFWFRDYFKYPYFIFEPNNEGNGINRDDPSDVEERLLALWSDTPENLRSLFLQTLRRENAERINTWGQAIKVHNPTPRDWLELLGSLGWFGPEVKERRAE